MASMRKAEPKRKRVIDPSYGIVGYFDGKNVELNDKGARYWEKGFVSRTNIKQTIRNIANKIGHSIEIAYKGRTFFKEYPFVFSRDRSSIKNKGYKLQSGRRVLGTIKPTETIDVYHWSSNFTKDRGITYGLENAIKILTNEAGMSPRQFEIELVDLETGKKRPISKISRDKSSSKYTVEVAEPVKSKTWLKAHERLTKSQAEKIAKVEKGAWKKVRIVKASRDAVLKRCPVGTKVQSVILDKDFFDRRDASGWIKRHGFHDLKIDSTEETFRFRQEEPSHFRDGSFRTINLRPGVKAIVGCPR